MHQYLNDPMKIEKKSFELIAGELPKHSDIRFDEKQMLIVQRMIHTTADFEYANLVSFNNNAVERGLNVIQNGCRIYADTKMIEAGVNSRVLSRFGCEIVNYISDDDVKAQAVEKGVTRSTIAMQKACRDNRIRIFVIGNAPTALYALLKNIEDGEASPDLIIGVPVGFVGAAESKEALLQTDIPSIVIRGRKGGSTVAVAIVNALMYMLDNSR